MIDNLRLIKYLPALVFKSRITEVTFFITDACNMKCKHCFVLDALNLKLPKLSPDEIRLMSKNIRPIQRVHIGGGEPFTRTDIKEVVKAFDDTWKPGVVCMPTNGWYTKRIIEFIKYYGANCNGNLRIHFSINSPRAEDMDAFTQVKGSFIHWRNSITQALEMSKNFDNVTIVALSTFNEFNQHCFKELIDYLHKEIKVDDFSFQIARSHGTFVPNVDLALFREVISYYFDNYNTQDKFISAFRRLSREKSTDYFEEPKFSMNCNSGKLRCVISPTGDVYPCEKLGYPNLHKMEPWKIGNVRDFDYDLNKLIKGKRASNCYDKICNSNCHCDHNIDQSLNLLTDSKYRNRLLKNVIENLLT